MNLTDHILEYLINNTKAEISSFGVFGLKNSGARINDEQRILPPAKEITFVPDFETKDLGFLKYVSTKENISHFEAELELKKETNQWKSKLENQQEIHLENIGIFKNSENQILFEGKRIETSAPDFYGLEEITISEIKKSEEKPNISTELENEKKSSGFNKSILWIFLVLVPVLAILYFAFANQELLFGKKKDFSVKTSTHRIDKKEKKPDSAKTKIVQDSIKKDSVKITEKPINIKQSDYPTK